MDRVKVAERVSELLSLAFERGLEQGRGETTPLVKTADNQGLQDNNQGANDNGGDGNANLPPIQVEAPAVTVENNMPELAPVIQPADAVIETTINFEVESIVNALDGINLDTSSLEEILGGVVEALGGVLEKELNLEPITSAIENASPSKSIDSQTEVLSAHTEAVTKSNEDSTKILSKSLDGLAGAIIELNNNVVKNFGDMESRQTSIEQAMLAEKELTFNPDGSVKGVKPAGRTVQ